MRVQLRADSGVDDTDSLSFQVNQTVAQAVWLSGLAQPRALCSGLGQCGACKLRFIEKTPQALPIEKEVLAVEELTAGFRLACRHAATEGMVVEIPERRLADSLSSEKPHHIITNARLAVDLGTTSVCWHAFTESGWSRSGRELNPQMGAGSDVMSRIAATLSPGGRHTLQALTLAALRQIVASLQPLATITELCVAGNTAMTAILLGADCTGLAGAPYSLPETGNRMVHLPSVPPVWLPPQPAPFVGGDVSAGLAALLATKPAFPLLLADMGTNGEFALMLNAHSLLLTSVPLGPSLEGIGLSRGTLAEEGAVTGFNLSPKGLEATVWPGSNTIHGISGTGYLSLLHCLRRATVLDKHGRLLPAPSLPLGKKIRASIQTPNNAPWRLPLSYGLDLRATDVEELVKVRAAFSLAVSTLLHAAHIPATALAGVYVAGALGEHVPSQALEELGFLPAGLGAKLHAAGNTSLAGATLLLHSPENRQPLAELCASATILDLTASPNFMQEYMDRMILDMFN